MCKYIIKLYNYICMHEKNDFVEVSKNLIRSENNKLLLKQNNYVEYSSIMSNTSKF